jgi:hypothetical protein
VKKAVAKKQDKNSKKVDKKSEKAAATAEEYQIKPAKGGPSMDTSTWPLLLKVKLPYIINSALYNGRY